MKRLGSLILLLTLFSATSAHADRVPVDLTYTATPSIDVGNIVLGFSQTGTEQGYYTVLFNSYSLIADVENELNFGLDGEVPFAAYSPGTFTSSYGSLWGTYLNGDAQGIVALFAPGVGVGVDWTDLNLGWTEDEVFTALVALGDPNSSSEERSAALNVMFGLQNSAVEVGILPEYLPTSGSSDVYTLTGQLVSFSIGAEIGTLGGEATFGPAAIPEPSSLVSLSLGGLIVGIATFRRRSRS